MKHDSAQKASEARCEIFQEDVLIVRRMGCKIESTPQIGFFSGINYDIRIIQELLGAQ